MAHTIERADFNGSYLTHFLPPTMTVQQITTRLGFEPSDFVEKGTAEWHGTIDGHQFAIWDFKGARWSVYASGFAVLPLRDVFPEMTP